MRLRIVFLVALFAPITAQAAAHCFAVCEFYSTHTDRDMTNPREGITYIEKVQVQIPGYTELAKYHRDLAVAAPDPKQGFKNMFVSCLDTAAALSEVLFLHGDYALQLIDSQSLLPTTPEQACTD